VFSPAGRICNGQTPIATAIVDPSPDLERMSVPSQLDAGLPLIFRASTAWTGVRSLWIGGISAWTNPEDFDD
jgi:hypothetical protein